MRSNPYIVQGLKYASLTLLGIVLAVGAAAFFNGQQTASLQGRLISEQSQGIIPTVRFEEERAKEGFSAPASTHVIFTVPQGVRITRSTFFGGDDTDEQRYWGYCFSGNEVGNKQKGIQGKALYDGQFFYSIGERKAQSKRPVPADTDLAGILKATTEPAPQEPKSFAEILNGGQTCYVMSQVILPVGVDNDHDDLNNKRELEFGTDPNNPDTDGDGIPDGTEVFKTKTNPHSWDTDRDGLPDRCEDKNADGQVDSDETSALVSDTDRDGLCDGNGYATGCPEPKQTVCYQDARNERVCDFRPSSPAFGEDMNQNCMREPEETDPRNEFTFGPPDWDYKYNLLQDKNGGRYSDSAIGVEAPDFPIPNLPQSNQ